MRLIVHGQQQFGKAVLEALLGRDHEVAAVYCAPDHGARPDPLKEYALERVLAVHQPATWKDPAVWEQLRAHEADLCVMAYVTLMVPSGALNVPKHGSIQYHPSLLPLHKGPSSINWPIIFGETKTGLSIFWPDDGLDTGPILLQKEVAIGPDDTLGSLYFNQLLPRGVEAMLEAVELVRAGTAPKMPQHPKAGSYEGWCRKQDVKIDWAKPVDEVYNLIRGANPQPGAWTTLHGGEIQLFDCAMERGGNGKPGEITALSDKHFSVAAAGGAIAVRRARPAGKPKLDAAECAAEAGLRVGVALGR